MKKHYLTLYKYIETQINNTIYINNQDSEKVTKVTFGPDILM